jgi:hypothetical protein
MINMHIISTILDSIGTIALAIAAFGVISSISEIERKQLELEDKYNELHNQITRNEGWMHERNIRQNK